MNVSEPVVPCLLKPSRYNLNVAILHCLEGLCAHALGLNEPLATDQRLDYLSATLRTGNALGVRINLDDKTLCLHIGPELLPAIESVQTNVGSSVSVHGSILVHDIDDGQVEFLPNGVIVWIMTGGNFERTRTKLHIDIFICNDGNAPSARHGNDRLLPD